MRRILAQALVISGLVGLAGCVGIELTPQARTDGGAPVVRNDRGGGESFTWADSVKTGPGDTVYALARRHNVGVRDIIRANSLAPPYHLGVGQWIKLPRVQGYTVARGDTLYAISRRHGIDMTELARANGLGPPYAIQVGQRLVMPSAPSREAEPEIVVASRAPVAPPAAAPTVDARPPSAPPPKVEVAEQPTRVAARVSVPAPPTRSGRFVWPVRGKLLSGYGAKGKGLHNDGINIAAPRGTPVRAAENGVVVYAGNELRGFGNLLLVKHDSGWVSAYAHNERLLVDRGHKVRRGQRIAEVGSSGGVTTPQLHFELRRGKDAVDPLPHLGPRTLISERDEGLDEETS